MRRGLEAQAQGSIGPRRAEGAPAARDHQGARCRLASHQLAAAQALSG